MASDASNSTNSSGIVPSGTFCSAHHTGHVFTAWFLLYALGFPVFLSALYVLYRKWKRPRPLSHSDVFAAHLLLMEVVHLLGACFRLYSSYTLILNGPSLFGGVLFYATRSGRICFHNLTCVERYLAVVHPITYLRLKKGAGVTVRNVGVGLAWLFSAGLAVLIFDPSFIFHYQMITLACVSFVFTSFFTGSVFFVLIRPGPGEGGGDRKSISQSKRAALHTMAFILGAQMLYIVNAVLFYILLILAPHGLDLCLMMVNSLWLEFPNSLVLPLLSLHRAKRNV